MPPEADTPVMALFREWEKARAFAKQVNEQYVGDYDEAFDKICDDAIDAQFDLELRIMAQPIQNARDAVAKIVAWSDFGATNIDAFPTDERLSLLRAEIKTLVGGAA